MRELSLPRGPALEEPRRRECQTSSSCLPSLALSTFPWTAEHLFSNSRFPLGGETPGAKSAPLFKCLPSDAFVLLVTGQLLSRCDLTKYLQMRRSSNSFPRNIRAWPLNYCIMSLSYAQLMNLSKQVDPKDLGLISKKDDASKKKERRESESSRSAVVKETSSGNGNRSEGQKRKVSTLSVKSLSTAKLSGPSASGGVRKPTADSSSSVKGRLPPSASSSGIGSSSTAKAQIPQGWISDKAQSGRPLPSKSVSKSPQPPPRKTTLSVDSLSTARPLSSSGKGPSSSSVSRLPNDRPIAPVKKSRVSSPLPPAKTTTKDGMTTIKSISVSGGARKFVIPSFSGSSSMPSSSKGSSSSPMKNKEIKRDLAPSSSSTSLRGVPLTKPLPSHDSTKRQPVKGSSSQNDGKQKNQKEKKRAASPRRGFHVNPYLDVNDPLLRGDRVDVSSYIGNLFGYNRER